MHIKCRVWVGVDRNLNSSISLMRPPARTHTHPNLQLSILVLSLSPSTSLHFDLRLFDQFSFLADEDAGEVKNNRNRRIWIASVWSSLTTNTE
jgi:hypothetical protein